MLSRLVLAFLSRSKWLLISWLQSPSAVILEPKNIKSVTVSTVSPSICHEVTDQALFPSIARILNHWTSREVLAPHLLFPPTYHPTKSAHLHISLSIPQALLKLTGCQALCSVFCFGRNAQFMDSYFPQQGLHPHPLQWNRCILTTDQRIPVC